MEQPSSLLFRGSTKVTYKLSLLVSPSLVVLMINSSVLFNLPLSSRPSVFVLELFSWMFETHKMGIKSQVTSYSENPTLHSKMSYLVGCLNSHKNGDRELGGLP